MGLKITGHRQDGLHTIRTIFQEISLKDTLRIEPPEHGFQFSCNHPDIPQNETNICVRAWNRLKQSTSDIPDVRIELDKQIPMGAGLGGGSSNAAAVLSGINELLGLGYSDSELERMQSSWGLMCRFLSREEYNTLKESGMSFLHHNSQSWGLFC